MPFGYGVMTLTIVGETHDQFVLKVNVDLGHITQMCLTVVTDVHVLIGDPALGISSLRGIRPCNATTGVQGPFHSSTASGYWSVLLEPCSRLLITIIKLNECWPESK